MTDRENFKMKWHPLWEHRTDFEEFKTDLDKLIDGEVKELGKYIKVLETAGNEQGLEFEALEAELLKLREEVKDNADIVHGDMIEFSHGPTPSVEAPTIFKLLDK